MIPEQPTDLEAAILYLQLKQEEYDEGDYDMSYEDAIDDLTDFANKLKRNQDEED